MDHGRLIAEKQGWTPRHDKVRYDHLIVVDCEAYGGAPSVGACTEFGAVHFASWFYDRKWVTFHGVLSASVPSPENAAVPIPVERPSSDHEKAVYVAFEQWARTVAGFRQPKFVSDNNGFDWQWINCDFWRLLGHNPFGHSSRRIGDFASGLSQDFLHPQNWKSLRVTPHTHHPVDDAKGNVEALESLIRTAETRKAERLGR